MPDRSPNPESVPALRKEVRQLSEELHNFKNSLALPKAELSWRQKVSENPLLATIIGGLIVLLIVAIFGELKDLVHTSTDDYIDGRAKILTVPLEAQLRTLDEGLTRIEGQLSEIQLKQLSATARNPQSISDAKAILAKATDSTVKLQANVVEQSGKAFIEAALKEPAAWDAALAFLNYRSTLNIYSRTVKPISGVPSGSTTSYEPGPMVDAKPLPEVSHIASIPVNPEDAARLETIGANLNQKLQFGTAELFLTGGALSLDYKYMRHVILTGVEVHYSGKALMLQDVLFVNCTFTFDNTQTARELAQGILASSPINFETGG